MEKSKILSKYPNLIHFFGDKSYTPEYKNMIMTQQVHGNNVTIIKGSNKKLIKSSDGLVTDQQLILGIRTADCLPIFFYDPEKKIIAAVHAGWKGLSMRIIRNTTTALRKLGSNQKDLEVAIGPHIQVCCYNVSKDRIEKFKLTDSNYSMYLSQKDKWYLDLGQIALVQLKSLGITDANIEISDVCTSCDKNYWSFRRDGDNSRRMINVLGMTE